MSTESINLSVVIPASPEQIYQAWMINTNHSSFGGVFVAGSGYMSGRTLELEPYRRIVQAWRPQDHSFRNADTRLEIMLDEVAEGTRVTLRQTGIPKGQGKGYRQGWIDYCLEPLKSYFAASGIGTKSSSPHLAGVAR